MDHSGNNTSTEQEFDTDGLRQFSLDDFSQMQIDRSRNLYFNRHKLQTETVVHLTKWQLTIAAIAAIATVISATATGISTYWGARYTARYLAVAVAKNGVSSTQTQNDLFKQIIEWDTRTRQGTEDRLSAIESTLRDLQASRPVDAQTYTNLKLSFDRIATAIQSILDRLRVNNAPKYLPPSEKHHHE
jgi:hypothetical protein